LEPHSSFEALLPLRSDLALALRAAAAQGLSEGVCNHFSVAVPGRADWFLLNPRGLHWSEVQAPDIVMCNAAGDQSDDCVLMTTRSPSRGSRYLSLTNKVQPVSVNGVCDEPGGFLT